MKSLKITIQIVIATLLLSADVSAQKKQEVFEIRTYILNTEEQEKIIDSYLETSLLPFFKRNGIRETGVFKQAGGDTLQNRRIYLFIPYSNIKHFEKVTKSVSSDKIYQESAKSYLSSPHNRAPFYRIETVLLSAFSGMPFYVKPEFSSPRKERIYELRSYESATEELHSRKVEMFNRGGEIALFKRLNFNAVFYGKVIAGSKMPNLMYMTSFENMASRDEHWKTFGADSEWKKLAALEYYKNTVSRNEKIFLYPTDYSDL